MNWWKQAQFNKEAGILEWISKLTSKPISRALIAALVSSGLINQFINSLKAAETQEQRDTIVEKAQQDPRLKSDYVDESGVDWSLWPEVRPSMPNEKAKTEPAATQPSKNEIKHTLTNQPPSNDKRIPRGIRNNNPGNIDWHKNINWQGMDENQHDGRFIRFETPEHGLRAMARVLRTYQQKHKLNTIRKIVSRWAPPSENRTGSYVNAISKKTGIPANQRINLEDDATLAKIMNAMIAHENGRNIYTNNQIMTGIGME